MAASAVGAAAALARVADDLGLTVTVLGTPAEEGGGGKILMLDRGAFEGVDVAMMVHPGPVDVAEAEPFAVAHLGVQYTGRAAHAAAYPEQGRNRRRLHRRPGRHRPAAPAAAVDHAGARAGDARGRGAQRHPRAHSRALVCARLEPGGAGTGPAPRRGLLPGGGAGCRLRAGDRAGEPPVLGVPQRRGADRALPPQCRGHRPPLRRAGRSGGADEPGLDRHGQCLPRPAGAAPLHRHRLTARGQPPAGVRRRLRDPGSGRRPARRCACARPDRSRSGLPESVNRGLTDPGSR
ncbi:hypothetical protein [Peterkaempfera sp. SMS 1(5)a]|uniref:hypothetical protein n=1 Tax=Peterkaempfera podocarpi TaxID=3232308 RepID=UPI00366A83C0